MNNSKLAGYAFLNAFGVFIYTLAIAWFFFNAGRFFGQVKSFTAPLALLLLFVSSATVVGLLVLGRPAWLYFSGAKADGVRLLIYTLAWLFVMTVATFGVLFSLR